MQRGHVPAALRWPGVLPARSVLVLQRIRRRGLRARDWSRSERGTTSEVLRPRQAERRQVPLLRVLAGRLLRTGHVPCAVLGSWQLQSRRVHVRRWLAGRGLRVSTLSREAAVWLTRGVRLGDGRVLVRVRLAGWGLHGALVPQRLLQPWLLSGRQVQLSSWLGGRSLRRTNRSARRQPRRWRQRQQ